MKAKGCLFLDNPVSMEKTPCLKNCVDILKLWYANTKIKLHDNATEHFSATVGMTDLRKNAVQSDSLLFHSHDDQRA